MSLKLNFSQHFLYYFVWCMICSGASFGFGTAFSPQLKGVRLIYSDSLAFLVDLFIFSLCFSISSIINGHDRRMFQRSRLDFLVNIIVAASLGFLAFVIINYGFRYTVIGRWVVGVSFIIYVVLIYFSTALMAVFDLENIIIAVDEVSEIQSVFESIRGVASISRLDIKKLDIKYLSEEKIVNDYTLKSASYIVVNPKDKDLSGMINNFGSSCFEKLHTIDYIIEREFSVISPDSVAWNNWWEVPTNLRDDFCSTAKRVVDLFWVGILAFAAVPILIVAAVFIKFEDWGPVFYRQIRLGQFQVPFSILKLRSMRVSSESDGAQWASENDSRVTRVGRILRKTRVDELPQLWNILRGEMSMIGPRPERPEFYEKLDKTVPRFRLRLACKPGLTGWAQVNYPYGASVEDARNKLLYDLFYITKANILFDFRIMSRTFIAMVRGAR